MTRRAIDMSGGPVRTVVAVDTVTTVTTIAADPTCAVDTGYRTTTANAAIAALTTVGTGLPVIAGVSTAEPGVAVAAPATGPAIATNSVGGTRDCVGIEATDAAVTAGAARTTIAAINTLRRTVGAGSAGRTVASVAAQTTDPTGARVAPGTTVAARSAGHRVRVNGGVIAIPTVATVAGTTGRRTIGTALTVQRPVTTGMPSGTANAGGTGVTAVATGAAIGMGRRTRGAGTTVAADAGRPAGAAIAAVTGRARVTGNTLRAKPGPRAATTAGHAGRATITADTTVAAIRARGALTAVAGSSVNKGTNGAVTASLAGHPVSADTTGTTVSGRATVTTGTEYQRLRRPTSATVSTDTTVTTDTAVAVIDTSNANRAGRARRPVATDPAGTTNSEQPPRTQAAIATVSTHTTSTTDTTHTGPTTTGTTNATIKTRGPGTPGATIAEQPGRATITTSSPRQRTVIAGTTITEQPAAITTIGIQLGARRAIADNDRPEPEGAVDESVDLGAERTVDPVDHRGMQRLIEPLIDHRGDIGGIGRRTRKHLIAVHTPNTGVEQRPPHTRVEQIVEIEVGMRLRRYPQRHKGTHRAGGTHRTTPPTTIEPLSCTTPLTSHSNYLDLLK